MCASGSAPGAWSGARSTWAAFDATWLDCEHLIAGETDGDHRSHDDLVRTFLTTDTGGT